MQRADREDEDQKTRSSSRRSSLSKRSSVRENVKKSPLNAPNSANSTPKKVVKPQNFEFIVTGKQILRRCDRTNSLPGSCRRASVDSSKPKRADSPKKVAHVSHCSKSQETSLEDDMSLDLSQVSDFGDTNSKYGIKQKFRALATSTPKTWQKTRSCSLQNAMQAQKMEVKRQQKSLEKPNTARSKESFRTSSSSPYRCTELDYSSVSPEYSGQSSTDLSPRACRETDTVVTPASQDLHLSSFCVSTWQDCSEADTKVEEHRDGEWSTFWANYNNSIAKVPTKYYYDKCPTPYRTETIDFADLDISTDGSRIRTPDGKNVTSIIRNEGLHLTPRETQSMIKCAHILGKVLSKAIERRSREKDDMQELNAEDPEREIKKKNMTLDLRETNVPLEVKEEKRCETVTTQTDISLPNTKSAPKIFENILRQLSKSSVDVPVMKNEMEVTEKRKDETNSEVEVKNIN